MWRKLLNTIWLSPELRAFQKLPQKDKARQFLVWLKAQDPATKYSYGDINDCLLAKFGRHLTNNYSYLVAGSTDFYSRRTSFRVLTLKQGLALSNNNTFGGAAKDLEKLLDGNQ